MSRTGFLLAEDEAVKQRFSNLKVYDDRDVDRPVQVFFRYPESETERTYPFITIEHIDIVHARNRQHSENIIYYNTNGLGASAGASVMSYWPSVSKDFSFITDKNNYDYLAANEHVPVDLLYQVSTFTRSALHDRQLSAQMLTKVVPFRQGFIEIPADGTMRRFDLLDWTTADLLDPEAGYRKRIFRKVYTLQMTAEIPSSAIHGVHRVTSVATTIQTTN
ncbi:hypothetical protein UFOVP361_42 [uncultured Caudovirales phage]|jgi:hypothetical protein|uniref:Uncharacterized protein n=1 Tax=uncultured Caudovirales phage TaxID=2100421 RepID=A0A6J7WZS8_9CAUD|nr:hypothetical protein UFOVP361_42 [uncultured Caudovirales phage]